MRKLRLPQRFAEARMEDLDDVFACVRKYGQLVDAVDDISRIYHGLLLSGPVGVGKTHAMGALTRVWSEQDGPGGDHEFVTAPDMFERLPAFDQGIDRESNPSMYDRYRGCAWYKTYSSVPWLVINDLGKESRAGKLHDQIVYKLGRMLRSRNEQGLLTHITTNLRIAGNSDNTLLKTYGESIMSLLAEMVDAYEVNGRDRRKD